MHRLIVCSATYQQSSQRRPDLQIADPRNRLLARQQRLRLEAETIRDVSLGVSGLLSSKIGGPSVFPDQSPGVLDSRASKAEWVMSEGEDRYRRGMYTWFWRLTPYPFFTLFDAPDANTTCTRRHHSNTPVQALTLLNDPVFFECARSLAGRVLKEKPADVSNRVRYLIRLCLGREVKSQEQQLLSDLVSRQLKELSSAPEEAKKIVGKDCPAAGDLTQYAAWTVASRAVLNLDELITRE